MKAESAKCRKVEATLRDHLETGTEETDADQTERFACTQENKRLSAVGNSRYADLNSALRRLNTVTEAEAQGATGQEGEDKTQQ
jgi:hypothetical protein